MGARSRLNTRGQGVPSVQRAVIVKKDKEDKRGKKNEKELIVEGYGLQEVMITEGALVPPSAVAR